MDKINFSSQVTFLYFEDLEKAQKFFDEVLKLERIFDPGWACIWKVSEKAFIGAVDVTRGSIKVETRGGFLIDRKSVV